MKILVIGAGALGGYFGGRLAEAGRDVTFLVRPERANILSRDGLMIRSPRGDAHIRAPRTVLASGVTGSYDVVLLSCKAYDLENAIGSFAPAVGDQTTIIPMLNGMKHLETLNARFTRKRVFGGQCMISATLSPQGTIVHLGDVQTLSFGPQDKADVGRRDAIRDALSGAGFDVEAADHIEQAMWDKWVFIATLAAATSLLRSTIGDTVKACASDIVLGLLNEAVAIAQAAGFAPQPASLARMRAILTTPDLSLTASMQRDIESGARIEGDQIIGDLIRRADGIPTPLLSVAHAHIRSYEIRREREAATTLAHSGA